jgi:hypothetical protein
VLQNSVTLRHTLAHRVPTACHYTVCDSQQKQFTRVMEKLVEANLDEGTMELARKQALRAAFEEFDTDSSGALCFDEVQNTDNSANIILLKTATVSVVSALQI